MADRRRLAICAACAQEIPPHEPFVAITWQRRWQPEKHPRPLLVDDPPETTLALLCDECAEPTQTVIGRFTIAIERAIERAKR